MPGKRDRTTGRTPLSTRADPVWSALRGLTAARIGLARSGASLSTQPLLDLRLAHARARDAVHHAFDPARLADELADLGLPVLTASSAATDRRHYLMRPDLGRRLAPAGASALAQHTGAFDVVLVIADGLSPRAVETQAHAVLVPLVQTLCADAWRIAPLVVVQQGRVAIGDAVAGVLGASCVAILIGERPGLSSPDSMGIYLTFRPGPRTRDADRNCISNIRPAGIDHRSAAFKAAYMLREMRARGLSGVALKDLSESAPPAIGSPSSAAARARRPGA